MYDSMGSTGDNNNMKMRDGLRGEAGQKKKDAAVPLQRPKMTRGRVKIDIEFIKDTLKRRKTFSKRKNGVINMVKDLAKLTGTQVLFLVASETGHLYTFASNKLQPMLTSEAGKALIQSCLDSPLALDSPADVSACPRVDDDAVMDVTPTTAGLEKTGLTFQGSETASSESLGNMIEYVNPSFNVASVPGTTTISSQPTTSTSVTSQPTSTSITTVQESIGGLQVPQNSLGPQVPQHSLAGLWHLQPPWARVPILSTL